MDNYQQEFIEFSIDAGVLRFGEFSLKSGRTSPYFFNAGLFNTGARLAKLGKFYADSSFERAIDAIAKYEGRDCDRAIAYLIRQICDR